MDLMEYKVDIMPSVPMEEVDLVVTKFIEFAAKEKHKRYPHLEESWIY